MCLLVMNYFSLCMSEKRLYFTSFFVLLFDDDVVVSFGLFLNTWPHIWKIVLPGIEVWVGVFFVLFFLLYVVLYCSLFITLITLSSSVHYFWQDFVVSLSFFFSYEWCTACSSTQHWLLLQFFSLSLLLLLLLSRFSCVWLCATPESAAHQAPLSLGFSRQEHWSGLPLPSPSLSPALSNLIILCLCVVFFTFVVLSFH